VAVFICNDLWHPSLPYLGVSQKADIFVSLFNSSQGSMGSEFSNIETWGIINTFYARVFGIYSIAANRVGEETVEMRKAVAGISPYQTVEEHAKEDDKQRISYKFWGGSEIINPFGKEIAKAKLHETDAIFGEIHRDILRKKRILLPYLKNDDPYFTFREMRKILFGETDPPK